MIGAMLQSSLECSRLAGRSFKLKCAGHETRATMKDQMILHRLISEFRKEATTRHRKHVANVHHSYGRDIGLISKRSTNKYRYAPTDGFLKALILANVERRMEHKEFLSKLFSRYGLVFGEREAERVLDREEFDKKAFQANAERFEQRSW